MLTSLQAQVELGDCEDGVIEYRQVSCHCLPSRLVANVPNEDVAMHHQSLRGMTSAEAKKSFLNLIKSWPLHRATIFDVMVSIVCHTSYMKTDMIFRKHLSFDINLDFQKQSFNLFKINE